MGSHDGEGAARAGDVLHVSGDGDGDCDRASCARTTSKSRCQCAHLSRTPRLYLLHHFRLHNRCSCCDGDDDVDDSGASADGGHASGQIAPLRIVLPYCNGVNTRDVRQPLTGNEIGDRTTGLGDGFWSDADTVEDLSSDCRSLDRVGWRDSAESIGRYALAYGFPTL